MVTLESLLAEFPLPEGWESPERFQESVRIHGLELDAIGLLAGRGEGLRVHASAAQAGEVPWTRAYFELIERVSLVEAARAGAGTGYPLLDWEGRPCGELPSSEVMPESPEPELWRYARSNGVAAHTDRSRAFAGAAQELVERDRVLRCWRDRLTPVRLALPLEVPGELRRLYDFGSFALGSGPGAELAPCVAMVTASPREEGVPLVYGFSARPGLREAVDLAARECLQRLAFLWGEEIPARAPAFEPTADFHQEFYLAPEGRASLEAWLGGRDAAGSASALPRFPYEEIRFADITPAHLRGKAVVVKAVCAAAEPLRFGEVPGYPGYHPVV